MARQKAPGKRDMAGFESGSLDDLREEQLDSDPEFCKLWEASAAKRAIAIALVRMRKQAGYTQADFAKRAGWRKAFVSRLEGRAARFPIQLG